MATVTFKSNPVHTQGDLPAKGSIAPDFRLTTSALEDVSLASFGQKKKILSVNPSYDTGTCQRTARGFNERATRLGDAVVLAVSADLPFAQQRFCEGAGLEDVVFLSMMRDRSFAERYGLLLVDGPLAGLAARAVIVLDRENRVVYTELVPEIANEPNYEAALQAAGA